MTVGMMSTVDALARRSGAKARNSIAVPTGVIIPPPTPCRMRNTTSSQRLSACPHSAEATVKTAMANKKVRLVPKRSPIQPEAGIHTARLRRYATTTHCTDDVPTPNSRPRVGSATLTIVASRISMNSPVTNTAATTYS